MIVIGLINLCKIIYVKMYVYLYNVGRMYFMCYVFQCYGWDKFEGFGNFVFVFVVFELLKQVLLFCLFGFFVNVFNKVSSLYSNINKVLKIYNIGIFI